MTINCKGRIIDLSTPKIMGILNITPDSFYDGGRYTSEHQLLQRVETMVMEGADFIDVGGYSSKPNADLVTEREELDRIIPVLELISKNFPDVLLSIDTFRSNVAKTAVENGAAMINDIAAGNLDNEMMPTVARLKVPYIMMHMKGTPQTMQNLANYEDLIGEVLLYFSQKIREARQHGISDLILDPGFGFAKTIEQNYEMLQQLEVLAIAGLPLLIGVSRKSMIYKTLNIKSSEALNGTSVLNTIALTKGAKILRVHDVKQAKECMQLYDMCQKQTIKFSTTI